MLAQHPEQQESLWKDLASAMFNGREGRLPAFFQNMLPEGVLRTHLAQVRGCREDDHFALFAACGLDLPGAVKALPATLTKDPLAALRTQDNAPLDVSMTAEPLPFVVLISGVQHKLGLIELGGRYVARKRQGVTRIIGKLPQIDRPRLPEVEHFCLIYPDGRTPFLSKAFDIVAWSVYLGGQGSALALYRAYAGKKNANWAEPCHAQNLLRARWHRRKALCQFD